MLKACYIHQNTPPWKGGFLPSCSRSGSFGDSPTHVAQPLHFNVSTKQPCGSSACQRGGHPAFSRDGLSWARGAETTPWLLQRESQVSK